ncbi:MAG: acyltransferase [Candidatus Marinimicrobia bacterium]|nr:acyltransferase [Candidatus Neomarinimicrobiota bacterium]MBT3631825.1 acyltransferase [Candidatus Neomarinimicrobiota bacterium]MBT3825235.1 acyltransferase [Candidatus Neomarinimicrobiota bacterium]MBT4296900.1 acyltransferase [Candidatus Neomarinimicrobiota bacterium]MBT4991939.1 acyltransferase [Candidatus Neomarinimicrobiota bacterium]
MMILIYHCFMLPVLVLYRDKPVLLHQYLNQIPDYLLFVFGFDKAVDIFFILSAYLLCSQLLAEYSRTSGIQLGQFYIRRFFRIMPIYLFALVLYSLFVKDFHPRLIHNLLFIDNFYHDSIIQVGWSLSIEVQFYIILPFVILFLNRLKSNKGLILGILFIISMGLRFFICINHPELIEVTWVAMLDNPDEVFDAMTVIYTPTHARFGLLILGMMWAYLAHSKHWLEKFKRIPRNLVWPLFVLSISAIMLSLQFPAYHQESWVYNYFGTEINIWWLTLHRSVFGLGVLGVMILLELQLLPGKLDRFLTVILSHKVWRVPAQLSFPIYLFHFPVIFVTYLLIFRTTDYRTIMSIDVTDVFVSVIIATILIVTISMILHRFIERPMIQKGKALSQTSVK